MPDRNVKNFLPCVTVPPDQQGCLPPVSNQRTIVRSALSLAIIVTVVIVGLSLYAHRFQYEAQTEPDFMAVPVLMRVDRVTGKVQRYDYRNAKWLSYPSPADSSP